MYKIQKSSETLAVFLIIVFTARFTTAKSPRKTLETNITESQIDSLPANDVAIRDTSMFYNSANRATVLQLQCGGIITLPSIGSSILLDYKASLGYGNNERCLWTLRNRIGSYRVKPNVKITMLLNGFKNNLDVLNVISWNNGYHFATRTLAYSVPALVNAEEIFLSFHSDAIGKGNGFIIRIELLSAPSFSRYGDNYFYSSSSSQTVSFSTYKNNEATTIVVNPPASSTAVFTFSITNMALAADSYCQNDYLEIFEIINGAPIRRAKLCGTLNLISSSFRTNYPVLALLSTDASITGGGFSVAWSNSG